MSTTSTALPVSPSWKNMLGSRGKRISIKYRRDDSDEGSRTPWFLGPPFHFRNTSSSSSTSFQSPTRQTSTPFLTVTLQKLHGVLPDFISHLSQGGGASYSACCAACSVLEATVATCTSPSNSARSSPKHLGNSPLSPTTSPLLQWLTTSDRYHHQHHHPQSPTAASAMALEGEWEKYITPFWLFAATEFLYAELVHLETTTTTTTTTTNTVVATMRGLYQRINKELVQVRELLCTPLLLQQKDDGKHKKSSTTRNTKNLVFNTTDMNNNNKEAAASVAASIEGIMTIISCRIQLMEIQVLLFHATAEHAQLILACSALAQSLQQSESSEAAAAVVQPLLQSVQREVRAWRFALETCTALERCKFLETVSSAHHWRNNLASASETRLSIFLRQSYEETLEGLPIILDRIRAFAGHFYGINVSDFWKGKQSSLDNAVLDFLRKQEKLGGPPTAVMIVFDAKGADNLHVERGVQLSTSPSETSHDMRVRWPAVYMRCSTNLVHHPSSVVTRGSGRFVTSQSNLLTSWSNDASSPRSKKPNDQSNLSQLAVLEYGPEEGMATTWPHSEWEDLISTLTGTDGPDLVESDACLLPQSIAVTYQSTEEESQKESKESITSVDEIAALFSMKISHSISSLPELVPSRKSQNTFHVVSLGEFMSMVVMTKEEEESLWHRRRSRLSNLEIRSFLDNFAKKLRVSDRLSVANFPPPTNTKKKLSLTDKEAVWSDQQVHSFLIELKNFFGLRPSSPQHETGRSIFGGTRSPLRSQKPRNVRKRRTQQTPLNESAAALFLGPDLAKLIRDE